MFANAIMVYFITYYLSFYGTDIVGLSAGSVAILLVIVKQINAYQDPILGGILDRMPPKPSGKYRRWLIIGVIGCAIGYILLFSINPSWGYGVKLIWFYVFYLLGNLAASIHTTAYGAYQQVLTTDTDERSSISMWRMVGTGVGSVVPGLLAVTLLTTFSGSSTFNSKGFSGAVIVYCVIGALLGVLCTRAGKEVVNQKERQKISLKQSLKYMFCYRQTRWLTLAMVFNGLMFYGRLSVQAYWLEYVVGEPSLMSSLTVWYGVGNCCGAAVARYLCRFFKNKPRASVVMSLLYAAACMACFLAPSDSLGLFKVCNVIMGVCGAGISVGIYSSLGDSADLIQLKEGKRVDGTLMSGVTFANKFGGIWTPVLATAMLEATGYVPKVAQNTATIDAIMFNCFLLPALLAIGQCVCLLLVKFNDKDHEKILEALKSSNSGAVSSVFYHVLFPAGRTHTRGAGGAEARSLTCVSVFCGRGGRR